MRDHKHATRIRDALSFRHAENASHEFGCVKSSGPVSADSKCQRRPNIFRLDNGAPSESRRRAAPRIAGPCLRAPIFEQLHHVLAIELSRMRLFEVVSNVSELEANAVPLR